MKEPSEVPKSIQVNGVTLPYRVEQRSVKYPRLEFKAGELLVILPNGWKDETRILEEKKDWISKKHDEIKDILDRLKSGMRGPRSLPIFGDFFEFRDGVSLMVDSERRVIELDQSDANHLRRLRTILKKMLTRELQEAVDHYSGGFGVSSNRISVKKQRSKWGSCSFRGNLNFNLWLVCLPKDLVWYLACHEVAHLKEKGHGKAFWSVVGSEFENYREMEKKLFGYWFLVQEQLRLLFPSGRSPF